MTAHDDTIDAEYAPLAVAQVAPLATWTPSFAVAVDVAIERKNEKNRFFREVMVEGTHYGVIPGTGTKPALLKGGAEMLLANMGLNPSLSDADPPTLDITGKDHNGEPYIRYRRICRIYRQTGPTENERVLIAQAEGSCSSWETKYRYRNGLVVCPQCGKPAIIKGKAEYGGGFVCFKRKDGCGAKFADDDKAITSQDAGKIANPDIADMENTILKMADKRALVAATLVATGCSDIFTQDVEDAPRAEPEPVRPARDMKAEVVARARSLGVIAADGDIDALKAYCAAQGVAAVPNAINAHLDGLERAVAPAKPQSGDPLASPAQRAMLMALHGKLQHDNDLRHELYSQRFGKASSKELTRSQASAIIDELQKAVEVL